MGVANATTREQLSNFKDALFLASKKKNKTPQNWFEAFMQLRMFLESVDDKRKLVFIDEIPWFDTRRSNFLKGLEHFWNSWGCSQ